MWPFKTKQNNFFSITLNPQYMTCSWLSNDNKKDSDKILIHAYERTNFKSLEFENSTPFNPTKIGSIINNFIKKNNIKKTIISIAVSGPNILEKVVTLTTSSPQKQDFNLENNNKKTNIKLNYAYLCPAISENTNIGFNFYICGISQANLFQYKLLTSKIDGNLTVVTTELATLIELYKHTKNKNFNQSQLAIDLSLKNYDLKTTFSPEIINKISSMKNNFNINLTQECQYIAVSIGLFLLGNKAWKN